MRRLHPLSALERIVGAAVRTGATGFFLGVMVTGPLGLGPFWLVFALGGIGVLGGCAYGITRYLRFTYETTRDTLSVSSGVFNRQERAIPLGRIQNVDINQNLIQRVLRLAVVRFETAGGGSTEAVLDAVGLDEARRLREFVATHARQKTRREIEAGTGVGSRAVDDPAGGIDAGERRSNWMNAIEAESATGRTETLLYRLTVPDLLRLGVVTAVPAAPVLVVIGTPVFDDLALSIVSTSVASLGGPETLALDTLLSDSFSELALVAGVALVEFGVAAWLLSAALTIVEYYDFQLTRVGDELRYERGLLNRYSGSIPIEKIQTVAIEETAPMRLLGYARLSVETAGYGPGADNGKASNTAIPLEDPELVTSMAETLAGYESRPVERPPRRARRRYTVRYGRIPVVVSAVLLLANTYLVPVSWWYAPLAALPLAPLAGHLTWTNRGHALVENAFLSRSGFWRRTTRVVPYYRIQTVLGVRTVFQRYRGLASVTADSASTSSVLGGDATAHDVDVETARPMQRMLRDRLQNDVRERRRRSG